MDLVAVVVTSVLAFMIVAVNGISLLVMWRSPFLQKRSHYGIGSLLFAHLLQGLFVLPSYALKKAAIWKSVEDDGILCDTFRFSYMLTNYASCLCLLLITVDRFLAARFPLKHAVCMTARRVIYAIAALWFYTLFLCLIPFLPLNRLYKPGCKYIPQPEWVTFMLIAHQLSPFVAMLACYAYIFSRSSIVRRSTLTVSRTLNCKENVSANLARRHFSAGQIRTAKVSFVIIVCYIACWGPSLIFYLLQQVCRSCYPSGFWGSRAEQIVGFVIKLLTFLDGAIAPCIYCLKDPRFKLSFKRIVRRLSEQRSGRSSVPACYPRTPSVTHADSVEDL